MISPQFRIVSYRPHRSDRIDMNGISFTSRMDVVHQSRSRVPSLWSSQSLNSPSRGVIERISMRTNGGFYGYFSRLVRVRRSYIYIYPTHIRCACSRCACINKIRENTGITENRSTSFGKQQQNAAHPHQRGTGFFVSVRCADIFGWPQTEISQTGSSH